MNYYKFIGKPEDGAKLRKELRDCLQKTGELFVYHEWHRQETPTDWQELSLIERIIEIHSKKRKVMILVDGDWEVKGV